MSEPSGEGTCSAGRRVCVTVATRQYRGKRPVSLGHSYTRGLKGLRMPNIPYRLSLRQKTMLYAALAKWQMLSSPAAARAPRTD